jgi:hypothetical protein
MDRHWCRDEALRRSKLSKSMEDWMITTMVLVNHLVLRKLGPHGMTCEEQASVAEPGIIAWV